MASQATLIVPPLNLPATTIAQYVNNAQKSALSITLETTPTPFNMDVRRLQAFRLSNRYRLSLFIALAVASSKKSKRGGNFGPFTVTWNDGNSPQGYKLMLGYNGLNPVQAVASEKPIPGNVPGDVSSIMGGFFSFVAAPGTNVTVSSPYSGDGIYTVNIALETF